MRHQGTIWTVGAVVVLLACPALAGESAPTGNSDIARMIASEMGRMDLLVMDVPEGSSGPEGIRNEPRRGASREDNPSETERRMMERRGEELRQADRRDGEQREEPRRPDDRQVDRREADRPEAEAGGREARHRDIERLEMARRELQRELEELREAVRRETRRLEELRRDRPHRDEPRKVVASLIYIDVGNVSIQPQLEEAAKTILNKEVGGLLESLLRPREPDKPAPEKQKDHPDRPGAATQKAPEKPEDMLIRGIFDALEKWGKDKDKE